MAKISHLTNRQRIERLREILKRKDWTRGQRLKLMTALEMRKKAQQMLKEDNPANDR